MESSHHFHFSQIFSSLYLKGIIYFHFDIIYTEIVFFLATFLYSSESNVIFMDRPWTGIWNGKKIFSHTFLNIDYSEWIEEKKIFSFTGAEDNLAPAFRGWQINVHCTSFCQHKSFPRHLRMTRLIRTFCLEKNNSVVLQASIFWNCFSCKHVLGVYGCFWLVLIFFEESIIGGLACYNTFFQKIKTNQKHSCTVYSDVSD